MCQNPFLLGRSHDLAVRCFLALEGKLQKQPDPGKQFTELIKEYASLGDLEEIYSWIPNINCFLLHNCVLKPTYSTTKLRVVSEAPAKIPNNISVNLMTTSIKRYQGFLCVRNHDRQQWLQKCCMGSGWTEDTSAISRVQPSLVVPRTTCRINSKRR